MIPFRWGSDGSRMRNGAVNITGGISLRGVGGEGATQGTAVRDQIDD